MLSVRDVLVISACSALTIVILGLGIADTQSSRPILRTTIISDALCASAGVLSGAASLITMALIRRRRLHDC